MAGNDSTSITKWARRMRRCVWGVCMQRRQRRRRQCCTTHESNEEEGRQDNCLPCNYTHKNKRKQKHKWDIHPSSKGKRQRGGALRGCKVGSGARGCMPKGAYEHAHNLDPRRQHTTCTQTPHKQMEPPRVALLALGLLVTQHQHRTNPYNQTLQQHHAATVTTHTHKGRGLEGA